MRLVKSVELSVLPSPSGIGLLQSALLRCRDLQPSPQRRPIRRGRLSLSKAVTAWVFILCSGKVTVDPSADGGL